MTNRQLVMQAQEGDQAAFSALVMAHRRMVYGICFRMTGHADDADDLAHEAFIEAFLKLGTLRDAEQFTAWLRTLTLNLCRMWLRTRKIAGEELREDLPAEYPAEREALAARVTGGLACVSAPLRITLALHYLEGLSCEEIAIFLDVPLGTVMSRLHRGRAALKQAIASMSEEELPMIPDDEFTRDVDAEIAVLLAIFGKDPGTSERLATLLVHAPERLAQLVAEAPDEQALSNLARLLRRLGAPGIEVVLNVALLGEPAARRRATRVLCDFLARLRQGEPGVTQGEGVTSSEVYLLLDAVIRSTASADRKAALLTELIDAGGPDVLLLTNTLLCYPDAALPALLGHFWQAAEAPGSPVSTPVLAALARMGTRFVSSLLEALSDAHVACRALALNGLEAFARALNAQSEESLQFALLYRGAIAPEAVDDVVVEEAVHRTAALLTDADEEVRKRAIRVLGLLHRDEYREELERLAVDGPVGIQVVALRALAEFGRPESVPAFRTAACETRPQPARVAAVEALGRMAATDAVSLLIALRDDADPQVRQVAVVALGDIGGEDARRAVESAMHSADKALMRTAAKVLHTSPHFTRRPKPATAPPQEDRRIRQRLLGEEQDHALTRVFISVHHAIAALPEIRPYGERDLTRYIARACWDYATTRRLLIMDRLMCRHAGIYKLTELGKAVWRVEHYIRERYLGHGIGGL